MTKTFPQPLTWTNEEANIRWMPLELPIASPLHLPSCSFVQQHIRPSMTTRGAIRRDSIVTHLSSSCIISSYFWMTLAPSGDSRHLAEKMRFHEASGRLFPISSKWPILQNIVLLRRIWKCHRSDNRSRCMTRAKSCFFFLFLAFFFFFHAPCWGWLTGGGGVWIWRRESGSAAAVLGPIWGLLQPLACSYSLQSSLQESPVITHTRFTFTCFLPQVKHIAAHGAWMPRIHYGILIIALISTFLFLGASNLWK